MSILRAGILGCGHFGRAHARFISQLSDQLELVAFGDSNLANAHAFAQDFTNGQAAVFADHQTMFEQAKLDIAFICLPPFAHTDEVERAAERGIHLLVEKPIALESDHAWRMVEAAERAGICTQVGFMFRFGAAVEALKGMVESGETGQIGLMSARYFCNALHSPWWRERAKSGGQLVEQVIHMFDLMRYLMGEPVSIYSRQNNLYHQDTPNYTIEDVSATVVQFANGALGVVYATNNAIPNQWINDYRVVAGKLTAEFKDANHATFVHTDGEARPPTVIASEESYHLREIRDLVSAIRTGGETRTPLREGAKSLDLVLAARRSAETGAEVRLAAR